MAKLMRRARVSLIVCLAILVVSYQAVRSAIAEMEMEKNSSDETINSNGRIVRSSIIRDRVPAWGGEPGYKVRKTGDRVS